LYISRTRIEFSKRKKIPERFEKGIQKGKEFQKRLIDSGVPLKIITLTRDPVARNISAYFENLDIIHKKQDAHKKESYFTLISKFIESYEHEIPLNWFDKKLGEVTGINVFDYEFPKNKGFLIINKLNIQVLIMHVELPDETKNKIIGDFIDHAGFTLEKHNISSQKKYSTQYANFLDQIKLPNSYVEYLLNSKYSKHFYSDQDLKFFRNKWIE